MAIHVRDKPPLRHHVELETPRGRFYRWAQDEPRPENVFSGLRHSSTMPGGFESSDVVLPRKPDIEYSDLERLSTIRVRGAGGDIVSETRLERAPRVSGDRMSVSPGAVGLQAYLDDDKSASEVYVDRDLGAWRGPSTKEKVDTGTGWEIKDPLGVSHDASGGLPALRTGISGAWGRRWICEAFYDAGAGNKVGAVYYDFRLGPNVNASVDANWFWHVYVNTADHFQTGADYAGTADLSTGLPGSTVSAYFTPAAARRYAALYHYYNATGGTDGLDYDVLWRKLAVYGDHGLTRRGADPGGFYTSDVVAHAVRKWAPLLKFTEGADGTIKPSSFVIPHLVFKERTTAAEIVRQASRFDLPYWAVWEGPEFHWDPSRTPRKRWRARVSPAQLEETGPDIKRVWESVIVEYRDVDGSTRTVGPPGSGADVEDSVLKDSDPENPANKKGIIRRDVLRMGVATAASATQVGRRFLEESKLVDNSGRARLVGWVEDDRGVTHPYSRVRAGDTISFVDASDKSERRIVRADHTHADRSCAVDLDAPPEALDALLERLDVVLVPVGVGA